MIVVDMSALDALVANWEAAAAAVASGLVTTGGATVWARRRVGAPLQELLNKIAKVEYLVDGTPAIADPLTGTVLQQARPGIAVQVATITEAVVGEKGLVSAVRSLNDRVQAVEQRLDAIDGGGTPPPTVVIQQTLPPAVGQ